jgi:hypothetical protein
MDPTIIGKERRGNNVEEDELKKTEQYSWIISESGFCDENDHASINARALPKSSLKNTKKVNSPAKGATVTFLTGDNSHGEQVRSKSPNCCRA